MSKDSHHNNQGNRDKNPCIEHSHVSIAEYILGSNHSQEYIECLKLYSHFHNLLQHPPKGIQDYNFFLYLRIPYCLSCRSKQNRKDAVISFHDFYEWIIWNYDLTVIKSILKIRVNDFMTWSCPFTTTTLWVSLSFINGKFPRVVRTNMMKFS